MMIFDVNFNYLFRYQKKYYWVISQLNSMTLNIIDFEVQIAYAIDDTISMEPVLIHAAYPSIQNNIIGYH